jgi:hypothetical protein
MKHKQRRHGQAWAAAQAKGMLDPPLNTIILGLNLHTWSVLFYTNTEEKTPIMSFSDLIRERECLHGPNLEVYIIAYMYIFVLNFLKALKYKF